MDSYELAWAIHQANLEKAAKRRFLEQFVQHGPSLRKRLSRRLGALLIAFGNRPKAGPAASTQPPPSLDGLDLEGV